ncbi:DNA-3-methyladenine glycosylase family protein [Cohnella cholangitidis]|uniref:DNA-3-methyladenine glycosylase II n=1 Tax=Cohnella cholangitidis TaxID=2598458 RepID=A0A7G5BSF4_9BACL|nr:DNA-3-methyladenine glycosylase 2 family protein [Cohnella cholangitidis]QMV39888.1 DNA-3-methyladenine glycosylase 2 family protein [Cohnella cholangitidis]
MPTVKTKYFDYGLEEMESLARADSRLGAAIKRMGKVERVIIPDLFAALVHAIVGQLISAKAVHTIWGRMQEQLGEITARNMAQITADRIQNCGITMKKAVCIQQISQSVVQGTLDLDELHRLPDEEVIKKLSSLNGIGKWTAEMLLINAMERRDVVSWGDIAIRRGMMKLYGLDNLSKEQFERYRRGYSPLGSIASIYLWEISFQ